MAVVPVRAVAVPAVALVRMAVVLVQVALVQAVAVTIRSPLAIHPNSFQAVKPTMARALTADQNASNGLRVANARRILTGCCPTADVPARPVSTLFPSSVRQLLTLAPSTLFLSAATQIQCGNTNPLCRFWASEGECERNSNYMRANCREACHMC